MVNISINILFIYIIDYSVRISNLPEDTTESDLKELISRIGLTTRVYLAKDRETYTCKGYAFVNYAIKSDAEKAIRTINGHRYGSMILNAEWSK